MIHKGIAAVSAGLIALGLSMDLAAAPIIYTAVNVNPANFGIATTWSPVGIPNFLNGDTAIIPSGRTVINNSGSDKCRTLIIQAGGTFRNQRDFQVQHVVNNGAFYVTTGGSMNFNGESADPATWTGSGTVLNRMIVGGFGPPGDGGTTTNLDIEDNGWLQVNAPLHVIQRLRVGVNGFVEFMPGSQGFSGIASPNSASFYLFDPGGGVVYNTGGTIVPGREWQSLAAMGGIYRGPEVVVVANGTTADMVQMRDANTTNPLVARTGVYPVEDLLTVETNAVLIDANNEHGVDLTNGANPDAALDLQDEGEIRKTKNGSSTQWGVPGPMNYGVAGAQLNFRNRAGATFVQTTRYGNGGLANSGTLTAEHYGFASDASSFAIQSMGLPDRGVVLVPPAAICVHDETELPPGIMDDCLSTALTSVSGGIVTHNSTAQPVNDVTTILSRLFYVKDDATPLLVDLVSFEAVVGAGGEVTLVWETASEIDNVGFHVSRSDADGNKTEALTTVIIPAEGSPFEGAVYIFSDPTLLAPGETRHYILEDVDLNGVRTPHGPASASRPAISTPGKGGRGR